MDVHLVDKKAFTITGIRKVVPDGGGVWDLIKSDGSKQKLEALAGKDCDIGLCFGFSPSGWNDYMAGVESPSVDGFESYEYPATRFLLLEVKGKISEEPLRKIWETFKERGLPTGYTQSDLPTLERYKIWHQASDQCHVELMIPLK